MSKKISAHAKIAFAVAVVVLTIMTVWTVASVCANDINETHEKFVVTQQSENKE